MAIWRGSIMLADMLDQPMRVEGLMQVRKDTQSGRDRNTGLSRAAAWVEEVCLAKCREQIHGGCRRLDLRRYASPRLREARRA